MTIALIVACDLNNAIGVQNTLPWHIPADLKFFKSTTLHHTIIMGKNTFASLNYKALPNRRSIVVSNTLDAKNYPNVMIVKSIEAAIEAAKQAGDQTCFIIGGAQIYKAAMSIVDTLYITYVKTKIANADAHFPEFNKTEWQLTTENIVFADEQNKFDLNFSIYKRK